MLSATAIALSIIYPSDDQLLRSELKELRKAVGGEMIIIAGGSGAAFYRDILAEIDAIFIENLPQLRPTLSALRLSA